MRSTRSFSSEGRTVDSDQANIDEGDVSDLRHCEDKGSEHLNEVRNEPSEGVNDIRVKDELW